MDENGPKSLRVPSRLGSVPSASFCTLPPCRLAPRHAAPGAARGRHQEIGRKGAKTERNVSLAECGARRGSGALPPPPNLISSGRAGLLPRRQSSRQPGRAATTRTHYWAGWRGGRGWQPGWLHLTLIGARLCLRQERSRSSSARGGALPGFAQLERAEGVSCGRGRVAAGAAKGRRGEGSRRLPWRLACRRTQGSGIAVVRRGRGKRRGGLRVVG